MKLSIKKFLSVALLGFALAFILVFAGFILNANLVDLRGQLIAGDPAVNAMYPTTRNALNQNPDLTIAFAALASFWFWSVVLVVGFLMTWWLIGRMR